MQKSWETKKITKTQTLRAKRLKDRLMDMLLYNKWKVKRLRKSLNS